MSTLDVVEGVAGSSFYTWITLAIPHCELISSSNHAIILVVETIG